MDSLNTYPNLSVGIKGNWYIDPYRKKKTHYTNISVNEGDAINVKLKCLWNEKQVCFICLFMSLYTQICRSKRLKAST